MFNKILVAVDERESGQCASRFATDLSGAFKASVQVFHPEPPNGATRRQRDRELARDIAAEAQRLEADLIVLGLERGLVGRQHVSGSIRQQLTTMSGLPVMIAPSTGVGGRALGPARPGSDRRPLMRLLQHV